MKSEICVNFSEICVNFIKLLGRNRAAAGQLTEWLMEVNSNIRELDEMDVPEGEEWGGSGHLYELHELAWEGGGLSSS